MARKLKKPASPKCRNPIAKELHTNGEFRAQTVPDGKKKAQQKKGCKKIRPVEVQGDFFVPKAA